MKRPRLRFAMCLLVILVYGWAILPMVFPNTRLGGMAPETVRALSEAAFPQNWQLFAPNISDVDATLVFRCNPSREGSQWVDPELDALRAARTFRLLPHNKFVHAPRMIAAALVPDYVMFAEAHCEDPFDSQCASAPNRAWREPQRARAIAWAAAQCRNRALSEGVDVALRLTDYRRGEAGRTGRTVFVPIPSVHSAAEPRTEGGP